jgi:aerobic-type carbon monoxide dehydrogenase small subunit (CoxS/CutS family)
MGENSPSGSELIDIELTINGRAVKARVKARQHLADFLRQDLELTGTHLGCEHGVCGACTVMLDGHTARGCLVLAAQADGRRVDTIEGLSSNGTLEELREAFIVRNAAQCAYCSSGMLLTAHELVSQRKAVTREDIRDHMSGNICRCTGYHAIIDAIESVIATQLEEKS